MIPPQACMGPNPLPAESEGMEQPREQVPIPAASPDGNSPCAADHQVFAQIPLPGDSAFSSLLCSAGHSSPPDGAMGGPRPGSCRMGPGRGEAGVLSEELTHTTSPVPGKGRRR